jgi:uncharacterized protein (UPF0332 family)
MRFEGKHFARHAFTADQVKNNLGNAKKDLCIAERITIPEVRFSYAYSALIKSGIALLSVYSIKVKSAAGHHMKIIEKLSEILGDDSMEDIGNTMRTMRNSDFYGGGIVVTEKEAAEYLEFAKIVMDKVENSVRKKI